MANKLNNINIEEIKPLISPFELRKKNPITPDLKVKNTEFRKEIINIISGKDDRILAIVGPCSIHNGDIAIEYAKRLAVLRENFKDQFCVIMRVYFEKPRTSMGWRGLITDPDIDGSYKIEEGLIKSREILKEINTIGLPAGSEVLDPIIPQYIGEYISWAAIGARTTESQTHREISSGLSMPVGFKNGTDGSILKAVNAICSAQHSHRFIGIDEKGLTSLLKTKGNPAGHIILRGGSDSPNYYEESVEEAERLMKEHNLNPAIIIDCSHANSSKQCANQGRVLKSITRQIIGGNKSIKGFMLESNLVEGSQKIPENPKDLLWGQSITDECIGWDKTEELLTDAYKNLKENR